MLALVVGQISEETASQRTKITLSFGQVFYYQDGFYYFSSFSTEEIDCELQFYFTVKPIKDGTYESRTAQDRCDCEEVTPPGDMGISISRFSCYNEDESESVEIVSSDNVAGIPSDTILLNPQKTQELIDEGTLEEVDFENSIPPQLVEQPVIDYTKVGNGLLKFTINLRKESDIIKVGQSFYIKLLYPSGIILNFKITEINELTMKLNCLIYGEVNDQRLYVEQTAIVVDLKYLFVLPGFITNPITTKGAELQNDEEEEEPQKEKTEEPEEEQTEEPEKEKTEEPVEEQTEEPVEEQTEEQEKEKTEEPEEEQTEEPEEEQTEEPEEEQTEEPVEEQTEEPEEEQTEEPEKEQTEEPKKEQTEEPEKEQTEEPEEEQTEEPEKEQTEEPEKEQTEEPEKEQTEEPEEEQTEEPEEEQKEEPEKEQTEEPVEEQTEEPEKEQTEEPEKEQTEEPKEEQTEEPEEEQKEEPEKEQQEESIEEQKEESEKEQTEEPEEEQTEEPEKEQTEEPEKEQTEESEKEQTEEREKEQTEEPQEEQTEEPEKEQTEEPEKEQTEEPEKEQTEEPEKEQKEEPEGEQQEQPEEEPEEEQQEQPEKEQKEEPEREQKEEPEKEQKEEPEKEQTEEPVEEQKEELEKEQQEQPEKERQEQPEVEQTEEPEKEQQEQPEREQTEEPEKEQQEEPEREQKEEPEKEQKEEPEGEQQEQPEKEQKEEPEIEQKEEPEKEQKEEPEAEQKEEPEKEQKEEPEIEQKEEPEKEKTEEEPEEKPSEKIDTTEQISISSTHESTNSTISESTEQATTQNVTPANGTIYEPTTDTTSEKEEESIRTIEEAKKISELTISFRQLTGFKFTEGVISFNFLSLITQSLSKGKTITLLVNLIGINGMDEEATEITCTLGENVEVTDNESKQAIFSCLRNGLNKSKGYISFRLNSSDDIAGIPTEDEIALNPVLTDEAITNNEIKNYTADSSVPPSFVFDTIDLQNCKTDGKFAIKGSLSGISTIASNKFTIPLSYPEGTSITCTFEGENLQCIGDKELSGTMILEQAIIADKTEELFTLKNISFDNMNCNNGLLKEASEKINVKISFRQVSHIQKESNGLSFFFAAFVNADLPASYVITMNVIVIINEEKVEKVANCTLKEAVTSSGTAVQGDFNCLVALESNENVAPENLTISTNNDNIGGCSELTKEEASPKLTDDAIEESKNKPDLGKVLDYSLAENKGKTLPSFEISTLNMDKCESKGKLKVIGNFSDDINEEMTFEISFSFPASKIKCTVEKATKGQLIEISCKMQKVKKGTIFKDFVIEPKLLKKKNKEMFYINKKSFSLSSSYKCENFNELKLKKAKARKNSPFTFLQVAKPPSYSKLFFIALTRKNTEAVFNQTQIFTVTLKVQTSRRRRRMDTQELEDLNIICTPGNSTDNTGAFDCSGSANGDLVSLDIEDDNISGQTENKKILENPDPNYSQKEALVVYDSLPSVTITNVTSQNCSINGKFKIEAYSDSDLTLTEEKDNVTILFSTPDSSGNCIIEIPSNKRNLTINCENTESFTASEIIIPAQTIYEKDDTTSLFKIASDYFVPNQFACAVGDNSYKNKTAISQGSTSTSWGKGYFKNGSSGLSGGAIAGIVIACVVALVNCCWVNSLFQKVQL